MSVERVKLIAWGTLKLQVQVWNAPLIFIPGGIMDPLGPAVQVQSIAIGPVPDMTTSCVEIIGIYY